MIDLVPLLPTLLTLALTMFAIDRWRRAADDALLRQRLVDETLLAAISASSASHHKGPRW